MRKLIISVFFLAFIMTGFSQNYVVISGQVTNSVTGAAIANQPVFVSTDSSNPMFSYYNLVYTNSLGYYIDTAMTPSFLQVMFYISTFDCNGIMYSAQGMSTNSPLVNNFSISCGASVPVCTNSYTYTTQGLIASFVGSTTSPYPTTYSWSFGDGSAGSGQNVNHTYAAAGSYTVTLTTLDTSGCSYTSTQQIVVGNTPNCQAWFSIYPDTSSQGYSYFFVDMSITTPFFPVASWFWTFGDGGTSTLQHPTHVYNSTGFYTVCLTITTGTPGGTGFCTDTWCDSIYVSSGSNCNVSFTYTNTAQTAIFTASGTGLAPFSYTWSFGDGTNGTGSPVTHTYATAGTYLVTVYMIDVNGCSSQQTQSIVIGTVTTQQINGQVYAGNLPASQVLVTLMGFNPGTGVIVFDSAVTTPNGAYIFSNVPQGIFLVLAEPLPASSAFMTYAPTYYGNTPHWGTATIITIGVPVNPYNITLLSIPGPGQGPALLGGNVSNSGTKLFGKDGSVAPGIEIMLKDQGGNMLDLRYSDAAGLFDFSNIPYGTYEVYAEVPGLTTASAYITLSASNPVVNNISIVISSSGVVTSIRYPGTNIEFKAYPNPATDILYLEIPGKFNGEYKLFSQDGRIVHEGIIITSGNDVVELSLENVKQGLYFLQVFDNEMVSGTIKVVVK